MNWFRQLFLQRRMTTDLSEEMQQHLEEKIEELLADGMPRAEAVHAARRAFGNPTLIEQRSREVWISLLESIWADIKFALRQLRKSPGFTVTVLATIALGIGATVGIFSVVHAVLLRPLPYKDSNRLVAAFGEMRKRNASDLPFSETDFLDLRSGAKTMFDGFVSVYTYRMLLKHRDGTAEQVGSASVTANFFQFLGGKIALGRDFDNSDAQAQSSVGSSAQNPQSEHSSSNVAILSYEYWQHRYDGSPAVLGQRLSRDDENSPVIIGVLAPGFELLFPSRVDVERLPDVWLPAHLTYDNAQRNQLSQRVIGRLKKGVSLANAQTEVDRVAMDLRKSNSIWQTSDFHIQLQPMHKYLIAELRPYILALMGAAIFLLLIACANVANLLLVRMSLRERELAVRTALGGGRWHLIRQMLMEALLLAGAGTFLGLGLAWCSVRELSILAPPSQPLLHSVSIDPMVLAFTALFGLTAAALFGLGPAVHASRPDMMSVLRASGRNSLLGGGRLLQNNVVVAEIALSFALLVGAGLMFRSFLTLRSIDPGFESHGLLTFQILGPQQQSPVHKAAFMHEIQDRLRAIPGVKSVTAANPFPLADPFFPIRWGTEQAVSDPSRFQAADFQAVLPGYFKTLRTPLLAGRTFTEADNTPERKLVVIDQLLAAKAFPHEPAVGKRILIRVRTPEPEWVEVIGVVAHQRDASLAEPGREEVYFADGFLGHGFATRWAMRTTGEPTSYERAVRKQIAKLGGQLVLTDMKPMDAFVERAEATTRLSFLLIGVFASIAALLTALGVYGVLSTVVRQRTSEIGVRMALGASQRNIFNLIVGRGMLLGTAGVLIGFVVAFGLAHWMSSMLVGIKSTDPLTFAGITVAFFLIVAVSSWLPARRAARVDPMQALRGE